MIVVKGEGRTCLFSKREEFFKVWGNKKKKKEEGACRIINSWNGKNEGQPLIKDQSENTVLGPGPFGGKRHRTGKYTRCSVV